MKKILILIAFLIIISITTILLIKATESSNNLDYYSHTKAICNETNYCQDYQISCSEERAIMTTPITGAVAQYPKDWTDPRSESERELC